MAKSTNPSRWFDSSPEVIRLVVLMYVNYPLSLRNVEDLLAERGIDMCRGRCPKGCTVRFPEARLSRLSTHRGPKSWLLPRGVGLTFATAICCAFRIPPWPRRHRWDRRSGKKQSARNAPTRQKGRRGFPRLPDWTGLGWV